MLKLIDKTRLTDLEDKAAISPRKRSHYNLHGDLADPVQRLCIALIPGTYVQPHKHPEDYKWEMMMVVKGKICMLLFDDDGVVTKRIDMSCDGECSGIEIPPNTWHTLFPLDDNAVIMEIKQGPYIPTPEESFAAWAPKESTEHVQHFLQWALFAQAGAHYTR